MLTGYNTDFKFQGRVYHCQTEDGGIHSPFITSLMYHQGAILARRKTSYADIIKADCLDDIVRELMMEQHKQMIRDLMQGKLDVNVNAPTAELAPIPLPKAAPAPALAKAPAPKPAAPAPKPAAAAPPPPRTAPPPPKEEPKEKSLDDIILDFLAQEEKSKNK